MHAATDRQIRSRSPESESGSVAETQEATQEDTIMRTTRRLQRRARGQLLFLKKKIR